MQLAGCIAFRHCFSMNARHSRLHCIICKLPKQILRLHHLKITISNVKYSARLQDTFRRRLSQYQAVNLSLEQNATTCSLKAKAKLSQ